MAATGEDLMTVDTAGGQSTVTPRWPALLMARQSTVSAFSKIETPCPMPGAPRTNRALALRSPRDLSDSSSKRRSVRSAAPNRWQPPEGLAPDGIRAVVNAASTERDR